jgi:mgtE-like transporter
MVSVRRTAIARRAKRLLGYWRSERRTLAQGLVALTVSTLASFVAGLTLSAFETRLRAVPGLVILIPASVGMRGVISGATGARLGTAVATGMFEVTWARSSALRRNATVGAILTLASSVLIAALATVAGAAFGRETVGFLEFATISVVGGSIGSAIVLVVTAGVAIVSFRRGYDLDSVATPVVTAVGDMVTLPAIYMASFLVGGRGHHTVLALTCILAGAAAVVAGFRAEPGVRRILLEMLGVIVLVPVLDVLAGIVLDAQSERFALFGGLLMVIPPFMSQSGALGGILSSRLSSKLQLGVISPRGRPETPAVVDMGLVIGSGALIFVFIGAFGYELAGLTGFATPGAGAMVGAVALAGLLVMPVLLVLGYYLAVGTARFGLDPDNHSVPLITGAMDLTAVAAFVFALSVSGVAGHG